MPDDLVKVHTYNVQPIEDLCGQIRELYHSSELSIAHALMTGVSVEHYHRSTEESYYAIRGRGTLFIDDEPHEIVEGDLVVIPRGRRHYTVPSEQIELLVTCSPSWSPEDVHVK